MLNLDNKTVSILINLANIKSGLLKDNFVKNVNDFNKFHDIKLGIPILIPADENLFEFEKKDIFEIDKNKILSLIYSHTNQNYIGFKHAFHNFKFLSKLQIKEEFNKTLSEYIKQNQNTLNNITKLKTKFKNIGAFQTRNIPHFGHEIIMQRMLNMCNHLVINPVIGPKKSGDTTIECLIFVFKDLLKKKYDQKVSFEPILANMFYAGPREAVHHSLIRKKLGFDLFSVGRDHAGAENIYRSYDAPKLVEKIKDDLGIRLMIHSGAKFCLTCNEAVLLGDCNHDPKNFLDISGTKFRKNILKEEIFDLADYEMQINLLKSNIRIFEE